jgi:hypothetical protein
MFGKDVETARTACTDPRCVATHKGERRGRYYIATARLLALNESIRAERKPVEDPFTTPMGETPAL